MGYYLCTTALAITIGLLLANAVGPGRNIDTATRDGLMTSYGAEAGAKIEVALEKPGVMDTLIDIVPLNPVGSLAEGNLLQIIFFALIFGIAVTLLPEERSKPLITFFEAVNERFGGRTVLRRYSPVPAELFPRRRGWTFHTYDLCLLHRGQVVLGYEGA